MSRKFSAFVIITMLVAILVVVSAVAVVVAGGATKPPGVQQSANQALQNGKPFRFISPNHQHPVVRTIALGFFEACAFYQVDCVDNSFDGVDFTQMGPAVDIAISQGSSGAIPFVDKAVYAFDNRLIGAGIPSVAIHVQVPQGEVPGLLAWVSADQTDYAQRAAITIGDKLGGKGTVALTQLSLNDVENTVTRVFIATMKAKYPGIKVLEPQMEGADQTQAIAVAVAILQAHPEVNAAFGTTGYSPATWAKACQQVGKKPRDVLIIGMDTTRENLDLVKSGQVYALVSQPLYSEMYKAVGFLVAKLQGKEVNYANVDPAPIVTVKDIDLYYGIQDRVDASLKK